MNSYENAATALTLEEIVRLRTEDSGNNSNSLQEYIETFKQKEHSGLTEQAISNENRNSVDDIYKSLDTLIQERRITGPKSSKQKGNGVPEDSQGPSPMKSPVPIVKLRDRMDPLTHSLSELIVQDAPKSRGFKRSRDDDEAIPMEIDSDEKVKGYRGRLSRPILTPYRAVSFLREAGMVIELKVGQQVESTGNRSHMWRCEVSCGIIKGVSDSSRKVVAREMACKDFLVKLRQSFPNGNIPKYEVAEELLIDPKVFNMIDGMKAEKAIEVCHEMKVKIHDRKMIRKRSPICTYICTYYVGTEECVGESSIVEYAKLCAAKLAYEFLSGAQLYPTKYFVGEDCPPHKRYTFCESEVFQILGVSADGQPQIDFPQDNFSTDTNEGRRELARRKLSEDFKRARIEDENGRRNMPVDVGSASTASTSSSGNSFSDVEVKKEVISQGSDVSVGLGTRIRRVSKINKFSRHMEQEDDIEEDLQDH